MAGETNNPEIRRFGEQFCIRDNPGQDWRIVDAADVPPSLKAQLEEEEAEMRDRVRRPPRIAPKVTRSRSNVAVADALGLTADELADALVRPEKNAGSKQRVPDEHFDKLMGDLGIDPGEARDRFSGRYWQPASERDKSTAKAPLVS